MSSEHYYSGGGSHTNEQQVERLQRYHQGRYSVLLLLLLAGFIAFVVWASLFRIDQVARATGEVIASSRVQIIQSVDGGVLSELNVREGDKVVSGQLLATLDQTRIGAGVKEIEARLSSLRARAVRLRAEVTGGETLQFSQGVQAFPELIEVEQALFEQRRTGLNEELRTLKVAVGLATEEVGLVKNLARSGDVNRSEVIQAERTLNEAEAAYINRKNKHLEDARIELTKVEDEIAQNVQVLAQRRQQYEDSVFYSMVPGIVKNISVTTVGGVLRAGEELMQIIPSDDELIIEAKILPTDIAQVRKGLSANIRFDPYDYTIYGSVEGEVVYVSADTLKEESAQGEEIYYRAHITSKSSPVTSTTGRRLDILPGMTAQVDVRAGDRTVMEYLLKPLRKTLMESFGER